MLIWKEPRILVTLLVPAIRKLCDIWTRLLDMSGFSYGWIFSLHIPFKKSSKSRCQLHFSCFHDFASLLLMHEIKPHPTLFSCFLFHLKMDNKLLFHVALEQLKTFSESFQMNSLKALNGLLFSSFIASVVWYWEKSVAAGWALLKPLLIYWTSLTVWH